MPGLFGRQLHTYAWLDVSLLLWTGAIWEQLGEFHKYHCEKEFLDCLKSPVCRIFCFFNILSMCNIKHFWETTLTYILYIEIKLISATTCIAKSTVARACCTF